MHKVEELKEMLCRELEEYGSKGKLDVGSLDVVDKLAHTIKNLDKILEEEEYSNGYDYADGSRSYARGRGRNARRDAMGRYSRERGGYSRDEELMMKLREIEADMPDEQSRADVRRLMSRMER